MRHPIFRLSVNEHGQQTPVSCYRAMFMNKPAEGYCLAWHQDRWDDLDQDPEITIYTALDSASSENGCVHVIQGLTETSSTHTKKLENLTPSN